MHAFPGADLVASIGPSLDSPATEHSSVSLGTAHEAALRKRLPPPKLLRSFDSPRGGVIQSAATCFTPPSRGSQIRGANMVGVRYRSTAHCPRSLSRWSISTIAIMASAMGVARIPTQGSWRPQSRRPVEPFGPRKALLFVGCADRVRAFCWGLHAIPGADLVASIGPSLDVLSSRSALEKRCFSSAAPTGCVHSVGVCMPSLARIWWLRLAPVSTSCRAVRPSKSVAFRRLRRPGLTHPWRYCIDFDWAQSCQSCHRAQLGVAWDCARSCAS